MSHRNVSCQVFFHVVHAFLVGKSFPKNLIIVNIVFIAKAVKNSVFSSISKMG